MFIFVLFISVGAKSNLSEPKTCKGPERSLLYNSTEWISRDKKVEINEKLKMDINTENYQIDKQLLTLIDM